MPSVWYDLEAALIARLLDLTPHQKHVLETKLDKAVARQRTRQQNLAAIRQGLGYRPEVEASVAPGTFEAIRAIFLGDPEGEREDPGTSTSYPIPAPAPQTEQSRWEREAEENREIRRVYARLGKHARPKAKHKRQVKEDVSCVRSAS